LLIQDFEEASNISDLTAFDAFDWKTGSIEINWSKPGSATLSTLQGQKEG